MTGYLTHEGEWQIVDGFLRDHSHLDEGIRVKRGGVMTSTDPHGKTPAEEPESAGLAPCRWRGCRFAFRRNMARADVLLPEDMAAFPIIEDGWCRVPGCKRYFAADTDLKMFADMSYTPGGPKPSPGYRLSTEVASVEELTKREHKNDELETRLREAAAQTDERADIIQLEAAGTVVTLTQREAALVVYCPEEWAGTKVKACHDWGCWNFNRQKTIFNLAATVIGRPLGGGTVYAAVFPRIRPVSYIGWHEGERTALCCISADRERSLCQDSSGRSLLNVTERYQDSYELSLGNVTEIDWATHQPPHSWV